jgi:hypothetical protein
MLVSLQLSHNDGTVTVVDAHTEDLGTTSIIIHEGEHYMYAGMSGTAFTTIRYQQVSPPAELSTLTKNTPARIKPA